MSLTPVEAMNQHEPGKYKIYIAISESLPFCATMEELEKRLSEHGIEMQYKYQGQTMDRQEVSFKIGKNRFKGSSVDRNFSLGNIERILDLQKELLLHRQNKPNQKHIHPVQQISKNMQNRNTLKKRPPHLPNSRINKTLEILLKREEDNDQIPYELQRENKPKRKRSH